MTELTDEQIAREEKFLEGIPRLNIGALFLPPIWGPAHGMWAAILFYPIWLFADNMFYAAYAVLLGWACATDPWKLAPLSGVVALGIAAVSAYRSCLNAPRPYERCAISPLIVRDGAGESFPSRHAFSAFAIAASWFAASVPVAVVLLVAAGALAVCRVLGGVHFPRDVVAGAFIGSATGALAAFLAALL